MVRNGYDQVVSQFRYDSQLNRNEIITKPLVGGYWEHARPCCPHQLYVAHEVASRHSPRVLLADEVGTWKNH